MTIKTWQVRACLPEDTKAHELPYGVETYMQAEIDALRTALGAASAKSEVWQPIETAPKDGTRVLLRGYGAVQVAGYCYVPGGDFYAWIIANDVHIETQFATHWMSLPAAPQGEMK